MENKNLHFENFFGRQFRDDCEVGSEPFEHIDNVFDAQEAADLEYFKKVAWFDEVSVFQVTVDLFGQYVAVDQDWVGDPLDRWELWKEIAVAFFDFF